MDFFFLHVTVWWHLWGSTWIWACMHVEVWGCVGTHSQLLFHLFHLSRVSQSNPELANIANFASQFAQGSCLHLPRLELQVVRHAYSLQACRACGYMPRMVLQEFRENKHRAFLTRAVTKSVWDDQRRQVGLAYGLAYGRHTANSLW